MCPFLCVSHLSFIIFKASILYPRFTAKYLLGEDFKYLSTSNSRGEINSSNIIFRGFNSLVERKSLHILFFDWTNSQFGSTSFMALEVSFIIELNCVKVAFQFSINSNVYE